MRFIPQNLTIKVLSLVTLALGLEPLLIYWCARAWLHLPSEEQWDKNGGSGGPWGNEPLGLLFIFSPLMLLIVLPLFTLGASLASAVKEKRFSLIAQGAAICVVQLALVYWQFVTVFWIIE